MKNALNILAISVIIGSYPNKNYAENHEDRDFQGGGVVVLDFREKNLSFEKRMNITNEYESSGIVFSSKNDDLPSIFWRGARDSQNLMLDGVFFNLFRAFLLHPVYRVSVQFRDHNIKHQTHMLAAFDANGNELDRDLFTEKQMDGRAFPDPFTLTVSSCRGIASVVALERPLGAQRMLRIAFTVELDGDVPCPVS